MAETLEEALVRATAAFQRAHQYFLALCDPSALLVKDLLLTERRDNFEHITRVWEILPKDDLRRLQMYCTVVDWLLYDDARLAYVIYPWFPKPPRVAGHVLITNMLHKNNPKRLHHLGYGDGITKDVGMFLMEIYFNTPHEDDPQPKQGVLSDWRACNPRQHPA